QSVARFDYVFGADGSHSAARQAAGVDFSGYVHERPWSIADVELAAWPQPPATAHAFLRRGGAAAAIRPMPSTRRPIKAHPAHAFLQRGGGVAFVIPIASNRYRIISNTPDAVGKVPGLKDLAPTVVLSDTFQVSVKQAAAYSRNRVFIGGDAAHVHSPVGGRG